MHLVKMLEHSMSLGLEIENLMSMEDIVNSLFIIKIAQEIWSVISEAVEKLR